jgi:hypothetical protein
MRRDLELLRVKQPFDINLLNNWLNRSLADIRPSHFVDNRLIIIADVFVSRRGSSPDEIARFKSLGLSLLVSMLEDDGDQQRCPTDRDCRRPGASVPRPHLRQEYNQDLMRWISGHYHLTARFDFDYSHNAQFRDQPFFTLAMSGFLDVRWRARRENTGK